MCCGVALQLIVHKSTATEKEAMQKELEATLGLQLEHPHVVRTYKYTTRQMNAVRTSLSSPVITSASSSPALCPDRRGDCSSF